MSSDLWKLRGLKPPFPPALAEADFKVPTQGTFLTNSTRRNYTDAQETAQWLGGSAVLQAVLRNLMNNCAAGASVAKKMAVVHTTGYDAALEQACLALSLPVMTLCHEKMLHSYASTIISSGMLEARCRTNFSCKSNTSKSLFIAGGMEDRQWDHEDRGAKVHSGRT